MGYATVVVVTLAVMFFGWRLFVYTQLERDHVWVHFTGSGDLIGSLQPDDPVAILGVDVGQVEDITYDTTGVRAKLRFWKGQRIFRDAQAFNLGNGLMGMRFILLLPGTDSLHPLDRSKDVPGVFQPGIAEVMSGIREVVRMVAEIQLWIDKQADGSPGGKPLHRKIEGAVAKTDSVLVRVDRLLVRAGSIGPTLHDGGRIVLNIADSLHTLEPELLNSLSDLDTVLAQAGSMIGSTRVLARDADTVVRKVAGQLEPFTRDDSLLRKVGKTLEAVEVLRGLVEGRTSVKTNITLFGDNPSKRGQ